MLLDTNAVSELIRKAPAPPVAGWVSDHPVKDLFFSAVSEAELRYGAAIPPAGRRRDTLLFTIHTMLRDAFHDRVLPFDRHAARAYGHIAAVRRAAGRPVAPADCQIAANRGVSQHGGGNAQHSRFRGNGNRSGGSPGRRHERYDRADGLHDAEGPEFRFVFLPHEREVRFLNREKSATPRRPRALFPGQPGTKRYDAGPGVSERFDHSFAD